VDFQQSKEQGEMRGLLTWRGGGGGKSRVGTSSETQGLLVQTMRYFRASDIFGAKVYFKLTFATKLSLARKYRIVPTSSPWVSEDGVGREFFLVP